MLFLVSVFSKQTDLSLVNHYPVVYYNMIPGQKADFRPASLYTQIIFI